MIAIAMDEIGDVPRGPRVPAPPRYRDRELRDGRVRGDYRSLLPGPPPAVPARGLAVPRGVRGLDTEELWRFVSTHD